MLHDITAGAYCYAELGCMIKKSGADYAYIFTSFGPLAAFVRLWIECIIVRPCTAAIQSLSFSLYILKPFFPECDPPSEATRLLAAVCICFLGFVNCYSVKMSNMVQDYLTYAKVFALILICCTGFVQLGSGNTEHFTWDGTETDPTVIALSFYSGLFAYTGWNYLNFIIEEMKVKPWFEVHININNNFSARTLSEISLGQYSYLVLFAFSSMFSP